MTNDEGSSALRILLAVVLSIILGVAGVAVAQEGDGGGDDTGQVDDGASEDPADDASEDPEDDASEDSEEADGESEDGEDGEDDGDDGDFDGVVRGARVFGNDRISTAVAISQYEFRRGAAEVYLARADNFADAVAAGALKRGPVLLVPSCGDLPPIVADEITRLNPRRVVALGGPGAICDDILDQGIAAAGRPAGQDESDIADDDPRTEEHRTVDLAVGEQGTFDALEAGTVTIERTDSGVVLVETNPAEGWEVLPPSDDDDDEDEVTVRFFDGETLVRFDAEVDDGQVRLTLRTRAA